MYEHPINDNQPGGINYEPRKYLKRITCTFFGLKKELNWR
jgi:hypothetical protein